MRDFDVLVINLEGSDERLESVRHMLDREQVAWRRMPQWMVATACQRAIMITTKQQRSFAIIAR